MFLRPTRRLDGHHPRVDVLEQLRRQPRRRPLLSLAGRRLEPGAEPPRRPGTSFTGNVSGTLAGQAAEGGGLYVTLGNANSSFTLSKATVTGNSLGASADKRGAEASRWAATRGR